MGIKARIRLGYLAILGLLLAQGLATLYLLRGTSDQVVGAVRNEFYAGIEFNRILVRAEQIRRYEKEYFVYLGEAARRDRYVQEWETAVEQLRQGLHEITGDGEDVFTAAQKRAVAAWQGALDYYASGFLSIVQAVDQGSISDPVVANGRIREFKERFAIVLDGAGASATETYQRAEQAVSDIPADLGRLNQAVVMSLVAAVLLAALLSVVVPRSVSRPIEHLNESARRMSLGELDRSVELPDSAIEFQQLAGTLERMRVSQRVLLRQG